MTGQALEIPAPYDRSYTDVRYHAAGSEAEVYTAVYVPTGQRVALKILTPRPASDASRERRERRFLREASLLREAGGRHVARVYEVLDVRLRGEVAKAFSMEWLPDTFRDLAGRHRKGLPVEDLRRYLLEAVEGIQTLHESGVAVRDVRPENLLVSERGELKIADLGMARTDDSTGSILESSRYVAPEVEDGTLKSEFGGEDPPAEAYFPADVYGLGMIFYEAALGVERWEGLPTLRSVFAAEGPGSARTRNDRWKEWHVDRTKRLPPLRQVREEVPAGSATAIDGMVEKDRDRRSSLAAVTRAVAGETRGAEDGLAVRPASAPSVSSRRRPRSWVYGILGALLVTALTAVVVVPRFWRGVPSALPNTTTRQPESTRSEDKARPTQRATANLRIETEPSDAEVYVGGVLKGQSPVVLKELAAGGEYEITLRRAGYKAWCQRIQAAATLPRLRVVLEREALVPTPGEQRPTAVEKAGSERPQGGLPIPEATPSREVRAPGYAPGACPCVVSVDISSELPVRIEIAEGDRVVRRVFNGRLHAGHYQQNWACLDDSGRQLVPGVYTAWFRLGAAHAFVDFPLWWPAKQKGNASTGGPYPGGYGLGRHPSPCKGELVDEGGSVIRLFHSSSTCGRGFSSGGRDVLGRDSDPVAPGCYGQRLAFEDRAITVWFNVSYR